MDIKHEMRSDGRHRILINGEAVPGFGWAMYEHPAMVHFEGRTFMAFTDYYSDGVLPIETVLELKKIEA